jgi:hypothetical protein
MRPTVRISLDGPLRFPLFGSGVEANTEALGLRGLRIDQFSVGVGLFADAFHQGIVFLGVVTLRLEFIPEALDERQTLTGLLWIRALCHFTDSMRLTGRQSRRRRWLERAVTSAAGV